MKLTRSQKEEIVEKFSQALLKNKAVLLVNFSGMKVKEERDLKKALRDQGIVFEVIKNNLLKIALKKTKIIIDEKLLDQPVALIWSAEDEVSPSKITVTFGKTVEKLQLIGGIIDQQYVDAEFIKKLAALPSRDELYAQLVGSLNAPIHGLVNVLQGNLRSLVYILKQYSESRI